MPRKVSRVRTLWRKLVHNWSWWDTSIGVLIGLPLGAGLLAATWMFFWEKLTVYGIIDRVAPHSEPMAYLIGGIFFSARAWAIARMPQKAEKLDYGKISVVGGFVYVIRYHWISLMFSVLALACILGLTGHAISEVISSFN